MEMKDRVFGFIALIRINVNCLFLLEGVQMFSLRGSNVNQQKKVRKTAQFLKFSTFYTC
jgi:hypothetical protein